MSEQQDSTPAAPPDAPASPPDPPSGGAAATFPQFIARKIETERRVRVFFRCAACGLDDVVDDPTGLCRACWRPFIVLAEALREMRDKLMAEIRKEFP